MTDELSKRIAADAAKQDKKQGAHWHLSLIPLYMAIGSPGLLTTLVALSLGASVADIGAMIAAGAVAAVVFSSVWGRLSDLSGMRKRYLLSFFLILGPIFLALSMANSIPLLILLYTAIVSISSGVSPIAVMYTVESCRSKNWQSEVARYNSIAAIGNILGLLTYSVVAKFYETHWLFYISSAMCFLAAIIIWRTGREPEMPLGRRTPGMRRFNIRRLGLPKNLRQLTPIQLLFLAAFVHWVGINFLGVGQTPLMSVLGLSDSLILAVNCAAGVAQAIAFTMIAPRIRSDHKRLLNRVVAVRGFLILCWAALPTFYLFPVSFIFAFLCLISIIWSIFYALIWLPITTFAISQAPEDRKGSVQGELLSAIGVANAIASALGGLMIMAFGYTLGFIIAAIIAMLTIPILSRIDITDPSQPSN